MSAPLPESRRGLLESRRAARAQDSGLARQLASDL
jgi:hypothetical protein